MSSCNSNSYAGFLVFLAASSCLGGLVRSTAAAEVEATSTELRPGERLTTDGTLKRDPIFVAGGKAVVYSVDERRVQIRLRRLDLESGENTPLHEDSTTSQFGVAFSPDERYYAFNHSTGNLTLKLVIRDTRLKKDAEVTWSGRGGIRSLVFSPDSRRLLYCFAETGPQQIFSVNTQALDKKQLTYGQGVNNWPSFTPDGKTIVFGSSRDRTYEIYSMAADGSKVQRLTQNETTDIRPQVSPDGRRIAFVSLRDGNYEVYVMDLDGSNVRRVTHNEERDDYPVWHPDGTRLLVVSERRGRHDLYLLPLPVSPAS